MHVRPKPSTPAPWRRVIIALLGALAAASSLALATPASGATTSDVTVQKDVQYGDDLGDPLRLDAYAPVTRPTVKTPAVIFVHGGAWTSGDKSEWATEANDLVANTGWSAFSINYTLNSGAPFFYEHTDVQKALRWVKANAATLGIDPDRVALVGSSAGGQLAMLAGTLGSGPASGADRVKAVVSWSGISDMIGLVQTYGCQWTICWQAAPRAVQQYEVLPLASAYGRWYATSPIANVDPSDPSMLLVNSTNEIVPVNQMTAMASRLGANGVPVSTMAIAGSAHASGYWAVAWPRTLQFLQQQLAG